MTTHHEMIVLTEKNVIKDLAEGTPLPVHFVVKCETKMSSHILASTLGSEFTIITEQKTPLELECVGRRVSRTP